MELDDILNVPFRQEFGFVPDPGLTVEVAWANVERLPGPKRRPRFKVVRGPFTGLIGHVHSRPHKDWVVLREGAPEDWLKR